MIQHVNRAIPPAQLEECVRFYGILGFEPVAVPPSIGDRAVWLGAGATQIHLVPTDDARPEQGHVALVLGERYEATLAALRASGFEVEPRRQHWGSERAYVRDPASNVTELMAAPPPELPEYGA